MKYKNILVESVSMLSSLPEMGTEEYSEHVQELIDNLKSVKSTLKSGPDRKNYRKESGSLQRAIEALRYLNRRNQRVLRTEGENICNNLFSLLEYIEADIGTTSGVPRCNLTKTLQNMTNVSLKTASDIDELFGGFVPFYLCDATEAVTEEFKDFFINPLKEFKAAIESITYGLEGSDLLVKLNPASKKDKSELGFTNQESAKDILYKAYSEENWSNFSIKYFCTKILDPEIVKNPRFKGALSNIDSDLRVGLKKQLEIAGEDSIDAETTKASFNQTFGRSVTNYIITVLNKKAGYNIDKIK